MLKAQYHIHDSAVLDAPIDEVWSILRDMIRLLPLIAGDGMTDYRWLDGSSAEKVPARFELTLQPSGVRCVEEVTGRSEVERSVTYRMVGAALGIDDYAATYRLLPVTNEPGKTFLEWSRRISISPGEDPEQITTFIASLAAGEVAALKAHFARGAG